MYQSVKLIRRRLLCFGLFSIHSFLAFANSTPFELRSNLESRARAIEVKTREFDKQAIDVRYGFVETETAFAACVKLRPAKVFNAYEINAAERLRQGIEARWNQVSKVRGVISKREKALEERRRQIERAYRNRNRNGYQLEFQKYHDDLMAHFERVETELFGVYPQYIEAMNGYLAYVNPPIQKCLAPTTPRENSGDKDGNGKNDKPQEVLKSLGELAETFLRGTTSLLQSVGLFAKKENAPQTQKNRSDKVGGGHGNETK